LPVSPVTSLKMKDQIADTWVSINQNAKPKDVAGNLLVYCSHKKILSVILLGASIPADRVHVEISAITGMEVWVSIKLSMIRCMLSSMLTLTFKEKEVSLLPLITQPLEDHITIIG